MTMHSPEQIAQMKSEAAGQANELLAQQRSTIPAGLSAEQGTPFPIMTNKADGWIKTVPLAEDLPEELREAVEAYHAAAEEWTDCRELLGDQGAHLANARMADSRLIEEYAMEGKSLADLPSLTPNYDQTMRTLAEAHASHVRLNRELLNAVNRLMVQIARNREDLIAEQTQAIEQLKELADPYRRRLATIAEHEEQARALIAFYEETSDWWMPDYRGRPGRVLGSLPVRLP